MALIEKDTTKTDITSMACWGEYDRWGFNEKGIHKLTEQIIPLKTKWDYK